MKALTCIVCPVGCSLEVEAGEAGGVSSFKVVGNGCLRGEAYAREETCFPSRVVTATCAIAGGSGGTVQRIPVKSSAPCPKGEIRALLEAMHRAEVALPVQRGDTIIANWNGTAIDVVATRSVR
jgi:CxxC motif-containing protein